jgi:quercetin dioxygenase-like cupin family protein
MLAHAENAVGTNAARTTVSWLHATYTILVAAAETGWRLGMFEALHAADAGPPRHLHHGEDETIFVAEGRVRFWLDGETFERGPGEAVFLPRGIEHSFIVLGPSPARLLTTVTPGGFEGFFPDVAREKLRIPEDLPRLREVGKLYRTEFTGPPLTR